MMAKRKEATMVVENESSPFIGVEIVDRPLKGKHKWPVEAEVRLIAETVETGRAVTLAARAAGTMKNLQMALRHSMQKRGLQMHYRKGAGERIIAWAEKVGETSK